MKVYLVKRYKRQRKRNGKREYYWALRWEAFDGWKCESTDTADRTQALFDWFGVQWNNWRLPLVYLEVATLLGWRATEVASIREEDLLPDGFVRVAAENCKTRRHKYGWLCAHLARRGEFGT